MVGFTISPILWQNISRKSGLSAGRCQTPALRLVYDNENEIKKSPGRIAYDTTGYFTKKNLPFTLSKHHENENKMESFLEESVEWEHVLSHDDPVAKNDDHLCLLQQVVYSKNHLTYYISLQKGL